MNKRNPDGSSQALFGIKKSAFLASNPHLLISPKMSRSNLECVRSSESWILPFLKFLLIEKMIPFRGNYYLLEPMSLKVLVWTPPLSTEALLSVFPRLLFWALFIPLYLLVCSIFIFLLPAHQGNSVAHQSASAYTGQYTQVCCLWDASVHNIMQASCLLKSRILMAFSMSLLSCIWW